MRHVGCSATDLFGSHLLCQGKEDVESLPETPEYLPSPQSLLRDTQWADLDHALGAANDTPVALGRLLAADPVVVAKSIRHLEQTVHHQNTVYSATVPSALFVASILPDPRVGAPGVYRPQDSRRPLRAVLLDWLGEIADDVSDATADAVRRHGFAPMEKRPEVLKLRALRPTFHFSVLPFVRDPEASVRYAAVIAAAHLLDDHERTAGLVPQLREIVTVSSDQRYRHYAAELLSVAGRDRQSSPAENLESIKSGGPHSRG